MQKHTKDKLKKAAPLALGSSMLVLSMLPAAAAFAATNHYISNVKASANGTSVSATSTTTPAHLKVWYQFRATTPQGHTWILRRFESSPTFKWTPPKSGTYHVQAFALTQYQVKTHQWKAAVAGTTVTDSKTAQVSSISISGAPSGSIAPNTAETLSVVAKDSAGNTVSNPGTPKWSISPTSGATLQTLTDGGVVFDASAAGNYTVTATLDGQTATSTVAVYGSPSAIKLTPASSSVAADGTATDVVTAKVVDSNGNVVGNYNGTATVSDTKGLIASASADQPSDFATSSGVNTITFTNGMATFDVGATSSSNLTDAITATSSSSSIAPGTTDVTTTTPADTALSLAIASGSPTDLSATGSETQVTVQTLDAAGNTYGGGSYVDLTLTGPGTFVSGSTVTSETVFVGASGTYTVPVYSTAGSTGTVNVSASGSGLASANVGVPVYLLGNPAALTVTSKNETTAGGNAYTQYTVSLVDSSGHVIPNNTNALTVSDNAAAQGNGAIEFGTITSSGTFTATGSGASFSGATLSNGVATFDVETQTVGSGPVTLSIADAVNSSVNSATTTYSYTAEKPAMLAFTTPSVSYYTVKAGQTVTYSVQVEDSHGNAVSESGVPVQFSIPSSDGIALANGLYTQTVYTNANGVATLTAAVPSGTGAETATVTATSSGLQTSSASVAIQSITNTSNYASQVAITNSSGSAQTNFSEVANSSGMLPTIMATAENAIGTATTGDMLQLKSSNSNVVSVNTADVSSGTNLGGTSGDLSSVMAGTATITVTDVSNPSMPSATFSVTVTPGTASAVDVEYQGSPVGTSNEISATSGQAIPLTIVNADGAGDPIPVTGSTALTANLAQGSALLGDFRLSPGGSPINSVSINPGQSSVTVYYMPGQSETIGSSASTDLTASPSSTVGVPASVSASETSSGVSVSWGSVSGASSYEVLDKLATASSYSSAGTTTGTSSTITGLTVGSKYDFEVEAVNQYGQNSSASSVASATYGAVASSSASAVSGTFTGATSSTNGSVDITLTYDNAMSSANASSSDFTVSIPSNSPTSGTVTHTAVSGDTVTLTVTIPSGSTNATSSNSFTVTSSGLKDAASAPATTSASGTL